MKKKVLFIILVSFLLTGVVSAASSMWGEYKGKLIIRITVDGVPIKVSDAPAVLMDDRTMVPIYLLKEAGIEYEWDGKNQTVNIISKNESDPVPEQPIKLSVKDVYKNAVAIGVVEGLDYNGMAVCSGSGFMVMPGYFITNYHVAYCGGTGRISVKIDGETYNNGTQGWFHFANKERDLFGFMIAKSYDEVGRVMGKQPSTAFYIEKTDLPEVGDKVFAIGSPYGLENTVSEGIVSGIRNDNGVTLIQHTADTEHGSSGGALMDEEGFIIGITSSGIDGTNLDFAIPIKYVQEEINRLNNP